MAISPTPTSDLYRSLTFGGIDSADYGIYISGDGVYNSPSRAVEMVSVPGRNGDIPVDMGHWENIEVEYPCGTFAQSQAEFRQNFADYRNAIASQIGYQRLQDTYHPDEYREAIFVQGIEAEPTQYGSAGEFKLVFNCKPQRFLTSGEEAIQVTSGDTITNPTEVPASPILEVNVGNSGTVTINDNSVDIIGGAFGPIEVFSGSEGTGLKKAKWSNLKYSAYDPLTMDSLVVEVTLPIVNSSYSLQSCSATSGSSDSSYSTSVTSYRYSSSAWRLVLTMQVDGYSMTARTASSHNYTSNISYTWSSGTTRNFTVTLSTSYTSESDIDALQYTVTTTTTADGPFVNPYSSDLHAVFGSVIANSSKTKLGNPTYIDLEIGEAYKYEDGVIVPLNDAVSIGSVLPTLTAGENVVTYSGIGFTSLKIIPRWWRL